MNCCLVLLELLDLFLGNADVLGVQVVGQFLQFVLDILSDVGVVALVHLLLDGRGSQPQYVWPDPLACVALVEKEVLHDQIIIVILIGMVALVKHNHLKLLDLEQSVYQRVIQLLLSEHEYVELRELVLPVGELL